MRGLLRKDFFLIYNSFQPLYMIPLLAPIIVALQSPSYLMPIISIVISLLFACQVSQTMGMDESSNWWKIVTAMPISCYVEAMSKYILLLIMTLLSCVIVFLVGIIAFYSQLISYSMIWFYVVFTCLTSILYGSIIIPASYRFGTANSRYILMLFVFVPTIVPFILHGLKIKMSFYLIGKVFSNSVIFLLLAICIIVVISFYVSKKILITHQRKI